MKLVKYISLLNKRLVYRHVGVNRAVNGSNEEANCEVYAYVHNSTVQTHKASIHMTCHSLIYEHKNATIAKREKAKNTETERNGEMYIIFYIINAKKDENKC
jgi:hypothetical protein